MKGPPLGPGGEDITWPDQVAPRGRKASSTRKIKPQTSNHIRLYDHRQQHDRTHANQADHEAAKTAAYPSHRSCSRDLTVNRPHASRQRPNQPGVHGSKREQRLTG